MSQTLRIGRGALPDRDQSVQDRWAPGRHWLIAILFASVFLQRFAVPVGGATGISFNLFANLIAMVMLLVQRQVTFDPVRSALFCLFAAYASMSAMFNGGGECWPSAALAIVSYSPFVFSLRSGDTLFMDCLRAFRLMVFVCAVLATGQFFLQFVVSSKLLYTFQGFLPANMLLEGFGNVLPIEYGSPLLRSNGFFMVEPSVLSQYVALAIIIEMLFFQSKVHLLVYGSAILFSYSGTGLIVLVLLPAILARKRSYGTIAAIVVFALTAWATSELWHMDLIQQRASEFDDSGTSGHARFIAPISLLSQYLLPNPQDVLFGVGPGSITPYKVMMPFETHDPTWAKLLFEYGVVGTVVFLALLFNAAFVRSPSLWLSTALMIGYFTFGGEFLDTRIQGLLLVFCVLPKRAIDASSHSSQPRRLLVPTT